MNKSSAFLTNVQHGSLHDGPGVRTTYFFQGCNLHCSWCHNPETIPRHPKLMLYADKCIGCGLCKSVCISENECIDCGKCTQVCPAESRVMSSEECTIDAMLSTALRDSAFYGKDGGVTCSGGEPMLQLDALTAFLSVCKENGLHTAVDTAANVPWTDYERIIPFTDLFLVDYKLSDDYSHKRFTGVTRGLIQSNLKKFAALKKEVWIRMPIIPCVNDNEAHINAAGLELSRIGFKGTVELLAFHRLGQSKYEALGLDYNFSLTKPPSNEKMKYLASVLEAFGLNVKQ